MKGETCLNLGPNHIRSSRWGLVCRCHVLALVMHTHTLIDVSHTAATSSTPTALDEHSSNESSSA